MHAAWCASAMVLVLAMGAGAPALAQASGAQDAGADAAVGVDEIVVTSRVQRLYRTTETSVGKTAEAPLNIPQSIQILNAELIADQGARDITDLYRNIAGVSLFSYSGVTFRGFRQDEVYYDGVRGNPFNAFSVPQLFTIERVEVLKGPAGMLYGPGSPGGLINYVTKKPAETRSVELTTTAGDYGRLGSSLTAEGQVAGPVSARLAGFYEEAEPFRFNTGSEIAILDGGLGFDLGGGARLTAQYTRYDQALQGNRLRGVPVTNDGVFLTDIRWNHNEPTDYLVLAASAYQARLEGPITDWLEGDLTVRHFISNEKQQYHEPNGLLDTNADGVFDTSRRQFRDQVRRNDGLALVGNLRAAGRVLGLDHKLLVGADGYAEDAYTFSRITAAGVPNLSLRDPVYGLTSGRAYNLAAVTPSISDSRSERWGVYVQDQISLGERWIAVGGLRFDSFRDEDLTAGRVFEDEDVTFRAGLIHKPRPDVALYANWSEGFEPQTVANQSTAVGGPFAPVTGEQVEAGIKTAMLGGRLQVNAAVFRIVREGLLQVDPSLPPVGGRDQLRPLGQVTSDGFETDVSVDLTPNWVLTANYAYNDVRVTKTSPGRAVTNALGDRFANAPEHKAGFWTRYQVEALQTAFALGGEYVGDRISLDNQRVKSYAIFDVSLIKDFGPVKALLRVDNIFNCTYAASGFIGRTGHFPGEPRSVFLELRAQFGG